MGAAATGAAAGSRAEAAGTNAQPLPRAGTTAPPDRSDAGEGSAAGRSGAGGRGAGELFSARLEGSAVVVEVRGDPRDFYFGSCEEGLRLEKLDARFGWIPPTDERPLNEPYYLDGRYVQPYTPCKVECRNFRTVQHVEKSAEYVRVGSFDGLRVIETRPLVGDLRVQVRYSVRDATCGGAQETFVYLSVDEIQGVCCPPGHEGCDSSGPAGGWALDYESCADLLPAEGTYHRRQTDSHGCPRLDADPSQCCGCDDAGVGP